MKGALFLNQISFLKIAMKIEINQFVGIEIESIVIEWAEQLFSRIYERRSRVRFSMRASPLSTQDPFRAFSKS